MRCGLARLGVAMALSLVCVLGPAIGAEEALLPLVKTLQLPGAAEHLAFFPDGRSLLAQGETSGGDRFSLLIDTTTWESTPVGGRDLGHVESISPDGTMAVAERAVYATSEWTRLWGFDAGRSVFVPRAFSPGSEYLACGGNPIQLWNTATRTLVRELYYHQSDYLTHLDFSPDGTTLIASTDKEILTWDVNTGDPNMSIPLPDAMGYEGTAVSPDGQFVATEGYLYGSDQQHRVVLVNLESGSVLGSFPAGDKWGRELGFVGGGRFIVMRTDDLTAVFAIPGGRQVGALDGDPLGLRALGVSADGQYVAVSGHTGRLDIWDASVLSDLCCSGFTISKVDWRRGCVSIKNTTSMSLDLLGWTISDGDKSFTFLTSVLVAAGASYIVCPEAYNPGRSKGGLVIDESDSAVSLYTPQLCGAKKESTKRQ